MNSGMINKLGSNSFFSEIDIHFAGLISKLDRGNRPEIYLAAALISNYTQKKHICLDLNSIAGKPIVNNEDTVEPLVCPDIDDWLKTLKASPVVGRPGEFKPLILDDKSRLYLYRYRQYETEIAESLRKRAEENVKPANLHNLKEGFTQLFPASNNKTVDWQKVAALTAVVKKLCIITGGPGTGKTATVARILALLLNQDNSLKIALAAPTGKACVRMQESIRDSKMTFECSERLKDLIPEKAVTIHRLLRSIPNSPYFRYNEDNLLPYDVVVVDEASMVDLALMAKLLMAVSAEAQLILLGDKNQLASVEAGAVLGDICGKSQPDTFSESFCILCEEIAGDKIQSKSPDLEYPAIADCVVELSKSYRFGANSGIGVVSQSINNGDTEKAVHSLKNEEYADIKWSSLPAPGSLTRDIKSAILNGFKNYLQESDPVKTLDMLDRFRVLCALREGPYGVISINKTIERILSSENLIKPDSLWYSGRPVMVTRNNYNLKLYNGDTGVILPDCESNNKPRAFFIDSDGKLRKISPARLGRHETVFAMTVHKSQGSEYDSVLFILPDRDSPVVTRELIYTGITRAKKHVEILCPENVFRNGISARIKRTSGLAERLWL